MSGPEGLWYRVTSDDKTKITIGVVILVVAGSLIAFKIGTKEEQCALTGAGVESIVLGVTHGRNAEEITAASALVPGVCAAVIDKMIQEPNETVTFDLKLPSGSTVQQNVLGTAVLSPPPPAPPGSGLRILQCLKWDSSILYNACVDGTLAPPSS